MSKQALHITDQTGQKLVFTKTPRRIISLVPSITHLLSEMGCADEVVGITRFCKLPKNWKKEKTIIGGTKDVKIDRIKALQPDLILLNKEENTKETFETLKKIAPVYVSDVTDLPSNEQFILNLGQILNKTAVAQQIAADIQSNQLALKKILPKTLPKTVYFIWQKPWMTIGGDTFIHQMMLQAGFLNIYAAQKRYPEVDINALQQQNPEVILLSSEPFPFKEKHRKELQKIFPTSQILLVEGEAFTWFGAYPKKAFSYFKSLQKQLHHAHKN